MRHPWFNVRMAIASTLLLLIYVPIFTIARYFGVPTAYSLGIVVVGLAIQYLLGVRRALKSVNARDFPRNNPDYQWVYDDLEHIANNLDVPTPHLYLSDMGSPNAFAIGRKGNGHIVLDDSLFYLLNRDQIDAVLAHEISHLRSRDVIPMVVGQGSAAVAYYLAAIIENIFFASQHRTTGYSRAGHLAHAVVMCLVFTISRQREFVADADAAWAQGTGVHMANALHRIEEAHRQGLTFEPPEAAEPLCLSGHWSMPILGSTHPSVEARIDRLITDAERIA